MKLHYFWDGGKMPRLEHKCIASWKRVMPGVEIIEWNLAALVERNWGIASSRFLQGALEAKQWGFVIDVVRWVVLWHEGGVFLDADVELVKPLPEGNWLAAENDEPLVIAPGLGAAFEKGHPFVKAMLDEYEKMEFDPKHTLKIASPGVVTRVWERCRVESLGFRVLPAKVMNPLGWSGGKLGKLDEETIAIHWYAAHWFNWKQNLVYKILPRMGIGVGRVLKWFRK